MTFGGFESQPQAAACARALSKIDHTCTQQGFLKISPAAGDHRISELPGNADKPLAMMRAASQRRRQDPSDFFAICSQCEGVINDYYVASFALDLDTVAALAGAPGQMNFGIA